MYLLRNALSLEAFILEMVRIPLQNLQLDCLQDWLAQLDLDDTVIHEHCRFSASGYSRNLLCRTSRFDMLVLCWQPGQMSAIHDHRDSLNVTRVCSGRLTSRIFQRQSFPCETLVQQTQQEDLGKNDLVAVDCRQIHQLANTSDQKLITLHVYARPLSEIQVYCPHTGQRDRVKLRYSLEEDFTA
jgi:predicted metal-dependent enzyme (double-stranded beta helix superfamily)